MITSNTNLRALAAGTAAIPIDLVEEIQNPSLLILSAISRGLLMVFARWCPFPLSCLGRMRTSIPQLLGAVDAKLLLIDNDKLTPTDMRRLFGRILTGGTETFAIVDGEIRGESVGCPENYEKVLKDLCQSLLRE